MFERYTERARRVIFFARYEASALASSSLDTEHLLLGLMREGAGTAAQILRRNGLTGKLVRQQVEARSAPSMPTPTSVDMPLSERARRVLQHAADEAEGMQAAHIDTEHLLLGLLDESECLAAEILASKGVRPAEVREEARLRLPAAEAWGEASSRAGAFVKLADLLRRLEQRRAIHHVSAFADDAIRVEIPLPDEKWVATFFPDGRVSVEVFALSGRVEDESALARLFERLRPPNYGRP